MATSMAREGRVATTRVRMRATLGELAAYLSIGILFGIALTKGEVISWFRIQEMFRFQSFHMYGILGVAVATAAVSIALIRKFELRALTGELVVLEPKSLGRGTRYWAGGSIFGMGWGLTGACPGPFFALLGAGISVIAVTIASAVAGTWLYGYARAKLPH